MTYLITLQSSISSILSYYLSRIQDPWVSMTICKDCMSEGEHTKKLVYSQRHSAYQRKIVHF